MVGFNAIITQTIVLRQFLTVFAGNELVIGVVLAVWMSLTGAGAWVGRAVARRMREPPLALLLAILGVIPLVIVFLIPVLKGTLYPAGTMLGLQESVAGSFLLLIPYCMLAGALFTLAVHVAAHHNSLGIAAGMYSRESVGSVGGGVLLNLVLLPFLTTFEGLSLLSILSAVVALVLSLERGGVWTRVLIALLGFSPVLLVVLFNLDVIAQGFLYKGGELLVYRDTPYGVLAVTRQGEQTNVFDNGALLFSTHDVVQHEEAVHYAMVQHPRPRTVLLISGGISGTIPEILKYGVERVDYLEFNPWLLEATRSLAPELDDPRVNAVAQDARMFLNRSDARYDVVLVNLPDPSTAQINRYYSVEFFRQLRSHMNPGGIVSLGMLSSVDYYGEDARRLTSILTATLRDVFVQTIIIPGTRNYFLASDSTLTLGIAHAIERRGIPTVYVNRYYIDDELLAGRSAEILSTVDPAAPLNRDFRPVAYYRQILFWLSQSPFNPWAMLVAVCLVLGVVARRRTLLTTALFTGGLASAGAEVILIIGFQVIYGYVYLASGVIITSFMAGLAVGASVGRRVRLSGNVRLFAFLQYVIGAACMALPFVLMGLRSLASFANVVYIAFGGLTFGIALLVGALFSIASRLQAGDAATVVASLYSADLIGAGLGALVTAILLVPLLGVGGACAVLGLTMIISGGLTGWRGEALLRSRVTGG
jgi:spermidine synthase